MHSSSSLVFLLAQQAPPSTTVGKCLALQPPCQNFLARQAYLDVLLKCLKQSFHMLPTSEARLTLHTWWCFLLFAHRLANVIPRGSGHSLARMKEMVCLDLIGLSLLELISGHFLFNCIVLSTRCFLLTHCYCSLSPFLLQCGSLLPQILYFPLPLWSISGGCKIYSMSVFTKYHLCTTVRLLHFLFNCDTGETGTL